MKLTKQLRGLGFTQKQIKRIINHLNYVGYKSTDIKTASIVNGDEYLRLYTNFDDGMIIEYDYAFMTR